MFDMVPVNVANLPQFTMISMKAALTLLLLVSSQALAQTPTDPQDFFGDGTSNDAYLEWLSSATYQTSLFLPTTGNVTKGAAVFWSISDDERYVDLAVVARASGWLGFGLSDAGGMLGSDMMLFEAAKPDTVVDAYVLEERQPQEDDCQNWEFVNSSTDGGFLIVEARRLLVTGDLQDIPILDDSNYGVPVQRIIAAWGDDETFAYHGPNRARGAIRWFSKVADEESIFRQAMDAQADGSFFIGSSNYTVPAVDTYYADMCTAGSGIRAQGVPLDDGVTIIGFEPVVTSEHVHHYVVYSSHEENENATCDFSVYTELAYVWAPGDPPLLFPDFLGAPLGGSDGSRSFLVQVSSPL
jgi:hypothetical protein